MLIIRGSLKGVILFSLISLLIYPGRAFAGGDSVGTTGCTDSNNIVGCVASIAGSPGDSPGNATNVGNSGGGGGSNADTSTASSSSTPPCQYIPAPNEGPPPPGANPNGEWYQITGITGAASIAQCGGSSLAPESFVWVPNGSTPPPPPPDPTQVGAQALSEIPLPQPSITLSPKTNAWVNNPEWLWIDPSIWHPLSATATACNAGGCTTASATATPSQVVWSFGDGGKTTCNGPGTQYNYSVTANQTTNCSYTFKSTSEGYSVTATIYWSVTWNGPGGSTGNLPQATSTSNTTLPVKQIESVLVNPEASS